MLRAECGHRTSAHVGEIRRVDHGPRLTCSPIHQVEQRKLAWQTNLVIVDEVADDLHAREIDVATERTTKDVEVSAGHTRLQVNPRFDDRLA